MRVLVLEDDPTDALAVRRELADRFDVVLADTLSEALIRLTTPGRIPDVIVTDLNLPDSSGPKTLEILRQTAPGIPIVVSTGNLSMTVRRQLDILGAAHLHDKNDGLPILRVLLQQTESFHQTIAMQRTQMHGEIERVARAAAEEAANKAVADMINRLGLKDEEGFRMAIRLARGWDAAKTRFMAAIAAGLGSAILLAIGAGVIAIMRNHGTK